MAIVRYVHRSGKERRAALAAKAALEPADPAATARLREMMKGQPKGDTPMDETLVEHALKLLALDPDNVRDARGNPGNSRVGRAMWLVFGHQEGASSAYEAAVGEALRRIDDAAGGSGDGINAS